MKKWHIKNQNTLWKKALHTFDTRQDIELDPYITRVEEGKAYYSAYCPGVNLVYKVFKHDRRNCENCKHPTCSRVGKWGALAFYFDDDSSRWVGYNVRMTSCPSIGNQIIEMDMTPLLLVNILYRLEDFFSKCGWDHIIQNYPHIQSFFEKFNIPKMPSKNYHLGHYVREDYEEWLSEKTKDRSNIINTI